MKKIYTILTLITLVAPLLALSACSGHETLKAPCSFIDSFDGSPCTFAPVNLTVF